MQNNRSINRTEEQIGRLLAEGGFVSQENLDESIKAAQQSGMTLREALVSKGHISEETYSTFLSIHTRVPLVDLKQVAVSEEAVRLVPEDVARKYNVLPLVIEGDSLRVAMDNPQDLDAVNTLTTVTGYRVKPRLPTQGSVESLLGQYYRSAPQMEQRLESILGGAQPAAAPQSQPQPTPARATITAPTPTPEPTLAADDVARAPVVQALDMIIGQAVRERASDIHIEPREDGVQIRFRVDGALHTAASLPKGVQSSLTSRVKVLSGMDIAERRKPQDGHFSLNVGEEEVDFRVASIETSYGEKVVMRILNKGSSIFSLSDLGFDPTALQVYSRLTASPFGMILISGPTGSGKTTTLYASLLQLDAENQNIMTIEDPIEYHFAGINQTQVNQQAGITFATGLRGLMRLDPDIMLVGEIRDYETASVATQAALTGHLVLSSIHANDAASAITRLIDLGVEPFLVTSAVIGSVAQRLVRKVCDYCKTPTAVSPAEVSAFQHEMGEMVTEFHVGRGCNMCSRSGYLGRVAVFEILTINDNIRGLINKKAPASEIRAEAIQSGMITMRRDGMQKAQDGITTPQEVIRNVFTFD